MTNGNGNGNKIAIVGGGFAGLMPVLTARALLTKEESGVYLRPETYRLRGCADRFELV